MSAPADMNHANTTTSNDTAVVAASPTPPSKRAAVGQNITPSKPFKGLRHFSMMVCKKVEEKGTTRYNEVADELVQHVIAERRAQDPDAKGDEKNIRRRVYDALNVLMAMDIIQKDGKTISWRGVPSSTSAALDMLTREREHQQAQVEAKRERLRESLLQLACFRNLLAYNQERPPQPTERTIQLPFIVVNTHESAVIQCNMSDAFTDVELEFDQPFEINDDISILKRLGM